MNRYITAHQESMLMKKDINQVITTWKQFLHTHEWQELIKNVPAISSGCGIIYELPNFLQNKDEGFAIVDMRTISFAEPHYHPAPIIEIYIVLQGTALVNIGKDLKKVQTDDVVIIPGNTAHFTIPDNDYIIAVINIPEYLPEHYVKLTESNPAVDFDYDQFKKLIAIQDSV